MPESIPSFSLCAISSREIYSLGQRETHISNKDRCQLSSGGLDQGSGTEVRKYVHLHTVKAPWSGFMEEVVPMVHCSHCTSVNTDIHVHIHVFISLAANSQEV